MLLHLLIYIKAGLRGVSGEETPQRPPGHQSPPCVSVTQRQAYVLALIALDPSSQRAARSSPAPVLLKGILLKWGSGHSLSLLGLLSCPPVEASRPWEPGSVDPQSQESWEGKHTSPTWVPRCDWGPSYLLHCVSKPASTCWENSTARRPRLQIEAPLFLHRSPLPTPCHRWPSGFCPQTR